MLPLLIVCPLPMALECPSALTCLVQGAQAMAQADPAHQTQPSQTATACSGSALLHGLSLAWCDTVPANGTRNAALLQAQPPLSHSTEPSTGAAPEAAPGAGHELLGPAPSTAGGTAAAEKGLPPIPGVHGACSPAPAASGAGEGLLKPLQHPKAPSVLPRPSGYGKGLETPFPDNPFFLDAMSPSPWRTGYTSCSTQRDHSPSMPWPRSLCPQDLGLRALRAPQAPRQPLSGGRARAAPQEQPQLHVPCFPGPCVGAGGQRGVNTVPAARRRSEG